MVREIGKMGEAHVPIILAGVERQAGRKESLIRLPEIWHTQLSSSWQVDRTSSIQHSLIYEQFCG